MFIFHTSQPKHHRKKKITSSRNVNVSEPCYTINRVPVRLVDHGMTARLLGRRLKINWKLRRSRDPKQEGQFQGRLYVARIDRTRLIGRSNVVSRRVTRTQEAETERLIHVTGTLGALASSDTSCSSRRPTGQADLLSPRFHRQA